MHYLLKIVIILLLLIDLFFWAIAHGTGHHIPVKTNLAFGITALALIGLLFFTKSRK